MPPKQGKILLLNDREKEKYDGDPNNIIFRSSWELDFFRYLMSTENIIKFSSEETVIPYYNPVKKRMARYFMDFWALTKRKNGQFREILVEVKPYAQTQKPVLQSKRKIPTAKQKKNHIAAIHTYVVNIAKWQATIKYTQIHNLCHVLCDMKAKGRAKEEIAVKSKNFLSRFELLSEKDFHKNLEAVFEKNICGKYQNEMKFFLLTENSINKKRYRLWKWEDLLQF